MSWKMSGDYYGPCSCNIGCPCLLGDTVADRGWCSAALSMDLHSGDSDGLDLSGVKLALLGDWPSGFLAGNGTGMLYFDDATTSAEQQAALEAILSGQRGGVWEILSTLFTNLLPSQRGSIKIEKEGDNSHVMIG